MKMRLPRPLAAPLFTLAVPRGTLSSMIVDSHAHAFPPMGGPAGHGSARGHTRYMQQMLVSHHQPVRRADDGSVVRRRTLARMSTTRPWTT